MYRLQYYNPMHDRYGYLSLVAFGAAVLLLGLLLRSDFFLSIVDFRAGDHRLGGYPRCGACHNHRRSRGIRQRTRLVGQAHRIQRAV